MSLKFESYLESKGIHHELAVAYSPEQNSVAKQMNRTLLESAQSVMVQAGLPNKLWTEAVKCAAYIRNHTRMSAIKGNKRHPFKSGVERSQMFHT